jgi:O-antigen/teichoic acid export membrane protein
VAVGVVVPTLLAPAVARARSRGLTEASGEVGRGVAILLGLFVPASLGLMLTSGRVLPALFGPGYLEGTTALALVAARLPVLLVATWLGSALVAIGRERAALGATGLAAVAALIAVPTAALASGTAGIAAAVLGVEAVAAIGAWSALQRLGVDPGRSVGWGRLVTGCLGLVASVAATSSAPLAWTCLAGAAGYAVGWGFAGWCGSAPTSVGATA